MNLPTLKRPLKLPDLPQTVPAWVRSELTRFPELVEHTELLLAARSPLLVADKTWKTIAANERKRLATKGLSIKEIQTKSLLLPLARFLNRGVNGFNEEARLTIKDRRHIARRIQNLSRKLDEELSRFDTPSESVEWMLSLHFFNPEELRVQLSRLIEAAERWKTPRVEIHRPSEQSAHRTFFMRTLSRGFKRRYGTPLNGATLEFTSVYFPGTEKLDFSGVSRRLNPQPRRA